MPFGQLPPDGTRVCTRIFLIGAGSGGLRKKTPSGKRKFRKGNAGRRQNPAAGNSGGSVRPVPAIYTAQNMHVAFFARPVEHPRNQVSVRAETFPAYGAPPLHAAAGKRQAGGTAENVANTVVFSRKNCGTDLLSRFQDYAANRTSARIAGFPGFQDFFSGRLAGGGRKQPEPESEQCQRNHNQHGGKNRRKHRRHCATDFRFWEEKPFFTLQTVCFSDILAVCLYFILWRHLSAIWAILPSVPWKR